FAAFPLRRFVAYLAAADAASTGKAELAAATVVQKVQVRRSPLLDLAAVRWLAVPRPADRTPGMLDGDPRITLALADRFVLVYENRAALPRARIVHASTPVPDEDAARAW